MTPRLATLALSASLAAIAPAADAQQRDTTRRDTVVRLPAVEVIGSVRHAAGPSVSAGSLARIAVVSATELRAWEARLLSDALAGEPGISLYDDLGSRSKTTLVARGFTASPVVGLPQGISVFVDGVPVNEPDAGQVNFDLLPLDHVERVEILSGTASLLGPHSLGGAINLLTRRGGSGSGGEIELAGGSFGSWSAGASYGGGVPGDWSWYAGGGYASDGGWRQLTEAARLDGFVNVGRIGERAGVRLQAFAADGRAETAGSLPLSVYRVSPDSNLSAGDFEDIVQLHVALSAWRPLGAGRSALALWLRASDAERFNVNQEDDPDVRSFSDNRSLGASADWRTVRDAGVGTLALRVGAGGSANRSRVRIHAERIDPGLTTDIESPIGKLDAYGLLDWVAGPLTLSGGVRWDAVRIPFRNRLDGARDTTSSYRHLSPRGGASLAVGDLSVYVSAGRSFRPPALIELACADPNEPCPLPFALGDDPPLAPVVATTLEVGGRWSVGAAELTGAAYRTGVRDDIFLFPYDDAGAPSGSTIDGFFANIARTRREGVELGARVVAGPLAVRASWAATRATFQVDGIEIFSIREEVGAQNEVEKGDRMPLVPAQTAALGASLALPYGLTLGAEGRYTGERVLRGDEANEEPPLGDFWLADLRVGARIARWEVGAVVENVLDAEHEAFGTFNINQGAGDVLERFLSPGTPRTVRIVVRRRFGP